MSKEQREEQDRVSEIMSKQLRREQLLEQRIQNLEAKIEVKEIKARIKDLESFQIFVVIMTSVVLIYKIFA
jgi:hypothetical protein